MLEASVLGGDERFRDALRFDGDDPDNQFTYDQVEKKIAELLQAK